MTLPIFSPAPDFSAESTRGPIRFAEWRGGHWTVMLSCPFAFTPVCTTELGALARRANDFEARGVRAIVTTIDTLPQCRQWALDVERLYKVDWHIPIVADADRAIAFAYGQIARDAPGLLPVAPGRWMKPSADFAHRTLFVISPAGRIAAILSYPPNLGFSMDEVLRAIDGLQLGRHKLAAPADWQHGEDVVVARVTEDAIVRAKHGALRIATPYLRFVRCPSYAGGPPRASRIAGTPTGPDSPKTSA